ncbi:hypothetical protein Tco_0980716 [Tanacetum coccineum]
MTMDDVVFQTNNVVGNFNYPPTVPAYKPIMKFLLNCPLQKAFTNCPLVVYQNIPREFWSTVVAFDPFPSTDKPERRLLREFPIKFSVLNGQRPLTLDFKTFCSLTVLDYNNGKYVEHPTPETVLSGNYSSTKQVNSIQHIFAFSLITRTEVYIRRSFTDPSKVTDIELTAHMIAVNNQRESVSPHPLAAKPKKRKSQTVTTTLPKSQGPEASGALSMKSKRLKSKKPPTETNASPPKPTEGFEQSYSVSSGTVPDPQDLERNIQLASMGFPSTLNEGTRTSKPFPEGMAKTMPHPKGSLGDKDLGGNIPPTDMEPIHTTVADLSGTGKPSYEGEPDTQPMTLTYTDVRAILLSEDELDQESDKEDVIVAGDDMDEDIQAEEEAITPPKQDQPEPSNYPRKMSRVLFSRITDKQWEPHEEAAVSYANLRASVEAYYDENIAHRDQTDKLLEASMSALEKSSTATSDLYKGLNVITELLKEINNAVKYDHANNKKINEAIQTFAKISTATMNFSL